MKQSERLLATAADWLGTAEDPRGSNDILFNTAYYGRRVSGDAYPWCVVFLWYCFREAGLSALFYGGGQTASCGVLRRWAERTGQWIEGDYRPGDVLLLQLDGDPGADHAALLEKAEGGGLCCIEGNSGDAVRRVLRRPAEVLGAWRPRWEDEAEDAAAPTPEKQPGEAVRLRLLCRGAAGEDVRAMQLLLIGRGCSCGPCGADGELGPDTQGALKRFQRQRGLEADGLCGEKTWAALLDV